MASNNSKPQKTYKLKDLIREAEEAKHAIVIEAGDETFEIPPPELWDDDVFDASSRGPVAEAKAIMGDKEYARFREAGGRATLVSFVVEQYMRRQAVTAGESAAS